MMTNTNIVIRPGAAMVNGETFGLLAGLADYPAGDIVRQKRILQSKYKFGNNAGLLSSQG